MRVKVTHDILSRGYVFMHLLTMYIYSLFYSKNIKEYLSKQHKILYNYRRQTLFDILITGGNGNETSFKEVLNGDQS